MCCALIFSVAFLGTIEALWRHHGHHPSVADDPDLWAYWRARATSEGPNTIVLLGTSRMHLDFSLEAWRRVFPQMHLIQLAVDGKAAGAALQDLADDPDFRGTVFCELTTSDLLPQFWKGQESYVRRYRQPWGFLRQGEVLLRSWLQSHFVVCCDGRNLKSTCSLLLGHASKPRYVQMRIDRSCQADYSLANIPELKLKWLKEVRDRGDWEGKRQEWRATLDGVQKMVRAIQGRGGKVVFLRFPTSGEVWNIERALFPRSEYWNEFARTVGAPAIHFADVPELRQFTCPEDQHLDERDRDRFTQLLAEELTRRGVLESSSVAKTFDKSGNASKPGQPYTTSSAPRAM